MCTFFIYPEIRKLIKAGGKTAFWPEEWMRLYSQPLDPILSHTNNTTQSPTFFNIYFNIQ
jgi:hypothetical protein